MSRLRSAVVGLVLVALCAGTAAALARQPAQAVPAFAPAMFDAHLRFLADDLLEGRGIGTRGGRLAAAYIEAVFRAAGLEPGSPEGFVQKVPMEAFAPDPEASITIERGESRVRLITGEDFAVVNCGQESGALSAEPLFVGYAITAPAEDWDDFKGVDVRGRLLIAFVNEPGRDDSMRFGGRALTLHGRWRTKLEDAARRGAAGMLLIHTDADAGYSWDVARSTATKLTLGLADDPGRLALGGWIREAPARQLLYLAGHDLDELRRQAEQRSFRPIPLPISVGIASRLSRSTVTGNNVVGVLPGAGPEAVVLTAHLDHLGIGRAVEGDSIYNGAVDNGTALAMLLGLAQGYARTSAASHPTLVFVAADAEEEGLLGSIYQTRHPAVPLERTLAALNFEISNPWGVTRDVLVIGSPYAAFARALAPVLEARHLRLTRDQTPEQGFMFRSDQLAWAQVGIPAAWIDGGTDYVGRAAGWGTAKRAEYRVRTYHYPTDEVHADFDASGLVQLAEITAALVQRIGAGGTSAWKGDPELVGMKRPGAVR
jgi:Zn-dependent M28 family amino/carboxypeptidase